MALASKGGVEESISEFRKALEIEPDSPKILFNLALVYLRKGLGGKAAKCLSRCI